MDNIRCRDQTQEQLAKKYNMSQSNYSRWERAVKEKVHFVLFGTLN
ncbi:MAG: helix-turn-helix domain-containing protein [Clostridiales bacterium]|nr:helix-turn-helix domain-containing protein [Clostridiales bacterium]